jgi:hypothetical protein
MQPAIVGVFVNEIDRHYPSRYGLLLWSAKRLIFRRRVLCKKKGGNGSRVDSKENRQGGSSNTQTSTIKSTAIWPDIRFN